ncbi:RtcB family protein [candidate division WOR-3 bacterium]|nr:RtcB family protein [candidate division WOR-3 bacterium]
MTSDLGLKPVSENLWELKKSHDMKVPGRIYANKRIIENLDANVLLQLENVSCLPEILLYSVAMPDAHLGYGFPIGGVAAFPMSDGIISPGGIGFDINCGVRLLKTGISSKGMSAKVKKLTDTIFQNIPLGLGHGAIYKPDKSEIKQVLSKGARFIVDSGMGEEHDLARCESEGFFHEADTEGVSKRAVERGSSQLGSLGAGNHFIEIDSIEEIQDQPFADSAGLFPGEIVILIHSGSRGLGHQITTEWIQVLEKERQKKNILLKDRQLSYTEINSEKGIRYMGAMKAAGNFAFANRQLMTHRIRGIIKKIFSPSCEVELVYDCSHNIAMEEVWRGRNVLVHRKGATRANPMHKIKYGEKYFPAPVIVPGSMGTGFTLFSPKDKCEETFFSLPHGSGRLMSRKQACKKFREKEVKKELMKKGIYVKNNTYEGVSEEAPDVYKGLEDIEETVTKAGLASKMLNANPMGNIKG